MGEKFNFLWCVIQQTLKPKSPSNFMTWIIVWFYSSLCMTIVVCLATQKNLDGKFISSSKADKLKLMRYSWATSLSQFDKGPKVVIKKYISLCSFVELLIFNSFYYHLNQVPWWVFVNAGKSNKARSRNHQKTLIKVVSFRRKSELIVNRNFVF